MDSSLSQVSRKSNVVQTVEQYILPSRANMFYLSNPMSCVQIIENLRVKGDNGQ